jgi:hypothetical protein
MFGHVNTSEGLTLETAIASPGSGIEIVGSGSAIMVFAFDR